MEEFFVAVESHPITATLVSIALIIISRGFKTDIYINFGSKDDED